MAGDTIAIGSVEIISLVDVEIDHPLGLDHVFPEVPTAAWEPYLQRYPGAFGGPNVWRVQMGGYLLRSQGRTILVDTGLGPAGALMGAGTPNPVLVQPPAHLLENLRAVGVHPEEVDTVVLTHLHADHVGWNLLGEDRAASPHVSSGPLPRPSGRLGDVHPGGRALPLGGTDRRAPPDTRRAGPDVRRPRPHRPADAAPHARAYAGPPVACWSPRGTSAPSSGATSRCIPPSSRSPTGASPPTWTPTRPAGLVVTCWTASRPRA